MSPCRPTALLVAAILCLQPLVALACEASCLGHQPMTAIAQVVGNRVRAAVDQRMAGCHARVPATREAEHAGRRSSASSAMSPQSSGACRHAVATAAVQPALDRIDAASAVHVPAATWLQSARALPPFAPPSAWHPPPSLATPVASAGTLRI